MTDQKQDSADRRIFDNAHDAILIFDPADEVVLEANPRALEIYGFSREEFLGLSLRSISKHLDRGAEHIRKTFEIGESYHFETVQFRKDGSEMALEISASVFEYEGRPAILTINRDITERKRIEAELAGYRQELETLVRERTTALEKIVADLEDVNAELASKNDEIQRFLYAVAHDLRSPLITIQAGLKLARLSLANPAAAAIKESMERTLGQLELGARRMARQLESLLDLARAGRRIVENHEIDLTEIVDEAAANVAGRFAQRGVRVKILEGLPTVRGDRLRLVQIYQNLLDNAVKYMGEQAEPKIEIGGSREEGLVSCFVRDNGMGIDPGDQQRIFEAFSQLDEADGCGIGLALVKRAVEAHGGRIWVESAGRGQGCTFHFALPDSSNTIS